MLEKMKMPASKKKATAPVNYVSHKEKIMKTESMTKKTHPGSLLHLPKEKAEFAPHLFFYIQMPLANCCGHHHSRVTLHPKGSAPRGFGQQQVERKPRKACAAFRVFLLGVFVYLTICCV